MSRRTKNESSEDSYFALFECAPVAIWHEDFSDIKSFLDDLRATGVIDISGYLASRPESLRHCIRLIRVLHVNRSARTFYGAETQEELVRILPDLFDERALEIFDSSEEIVGGFRLGQLAK